MSTMTLHSAPLTARANPGLANAIKRFATIAFGLVAMMAVTAAVIGLKVAILYPRLIH